MQQLRFVIIGIGGYSLVHLAAIDWLQEQGLAQLTGVVALESERKTKPELIRSLQDKGIPLYGTIDDFFQNGTDTADVLTVPIGIHQHVPVSIRAMQHGLDVYCEKPLAATVQEADALIEVKNETGRKIAVGYQHIYSNSMQQLKRLIHDGKLGRVQSISLLCGWPRSKQYYRRNNWAGKLKLSEHWILDSPANNAHAHYLLNTLYLASPLPQQAANPAELRAELYRANHIESADLAQIKFRTDTGADCFISFAHCNQTELGPKMSLQCEKGKVYWQTDNGKTEIKYTNGETEEFDNLTHEKWRFDGFKDFVSAVRENRQPLCTPELARAQTQAVSAMHRSCPEIVTIPEGHIIEIEDWEMFPPDTRGDFRRVKNLDDYLKKSFTENLFFSEMGLSWAKGIDAKWVQARG
ncbi:MAG TPA: Gfo/Idh/MocA family oxidoreductase [Bacteroidetes bacterium]|nr:Gfo/Idh/MocA family oxidoreductase [Bacteroidota bacterium]